MLCVQSFLLTGLVHALSESALKKPTCTYAHTHAHATNTGDEILVRRNDHPWTAAVLPGISKL